MDLDKLSIDRGKESKPTGARHGGARRTARFRLGPWIWLALILGAGWLFRQPLMHLVDRLRLPEVEIAVAYAPDPMGQSAIAGVAANGYIVARNRAALSADTPGRIVQLNVEEGSVVKRGDIIARLYADEYEAAVQAALAELELARTGITAAQERLDTSRLAIVTRGMDVEAADARVKSGAADQEFAERELQRQRKLEAQAIASQQGLDQAGTNFRVASAQLEALRATQSSVRAMLEEARSAVLEASAALEQARAQVPLQEARLAQARATLDKTNVRAPFDGIVVLKDAEVGEVVSPNAQGGSSRGSVATMVDFSSLEIQVELPEASLAAAKVGEAASAWLDAYPERRYACEVQRIWPTANRQKATVEIRLVFDEPDERLRPEMGVRVVFAGAPSKAKEDEAAAQAKDPNEMKGVLVPQTALARIDGRAGLFVLERDVAHWKTPEFGDPRGGRVLILSGVAEGERVIVNPPDSLQDSERVLVRQP